MTSLRRRVALAIALPAVGILALSAGAVYAWTRAQRLDDLDRGLSLRAAAMAALVDLDGGVWDLEFDRAELPADELFGGLEGYEVRVAPNGALLAERAVPGAFPAPAPYPAPDLAALPTDRPLALDGAAADVALPDGRALRTWTGTYLVRAHAGEPGEGGRAPVGDATPPSVPIVRVTVVEDATPVRDDLRALLVAQVASGLVLAAVAVGAGWALSGRIVGPIDAIARRAAELRAPSATPPLAPSGTGDEIDRLVDALNASFLRLHAAFEREQRFTADASHELRTPLALIRTSAEVALRQPRSAEDLRAVLADVLAGVVRAEAVVTGLLTLARADAGAEGPREPVALGELARDVADELGRPDVAVLGEARADGDPVQLELVVRNLLTNALRHAPDGRVEVEVAEDGAGVTLAVRDTGEGIPAEALPHVFDRFYRVDAGRGRASGGAGLGLAIVRAVARRHGGEVDVESAVGRGTTVTVRLPRARNERRVDG